MQRYIRIMLSLVLILSNLSVAFSMHFCQGMIEEVKLNHTQNKVCKLNEKLTCCPPKNEVDHCENPIEKQTKEDDCCKDEAYADDFQNQYSVEILKVNPIVFQDFPTFKFFYFQENNSLVTLQKLLDFYVESNAPPIYIIHKQLVLYEG